MESLCPYLNMPSYDKGAFTLSQKRQRELHGVALPGDCYGNQVRPRTRVHGDKCYISLVPVVRASPHARHAKRQPKNISSV